MVFSGNWISGDGATEIEVLPILPTQSWLRIIANNVVKDYLTEIHNGKEFYGEGQRVSGTDITLTERGNDIYTLEHQLSSMISTPLKRIDKNTNIVPGNWVSLDDSNISVITYSLQNYMYIVRETAHTEQTVTQQGRKRIVCALERNGNGWSPSGLCSAIISDDRTMKLNTPNKTVRYEQPGSFTWR